MNAVTDSLSGSADDLSPLAWVHGELRRSLELAHKALHRHLKEAEAAAASDVDAVEPAVLRTARVHLHQGVGALELVGLPAAATMLRASEAVVQRWIAKPALADAKAVQTLEKASFALLDYLARLLSRRPVSSVAMFPQYLAVQTLAGADRVHPADLWPQDWHWLELPPEPGVRPHAADAAARTAMESLSLALMRQPDPSRLTAMGEVCASLAAGTQGRLATLWHLAAAFFEAQARGLLAGDVYTKRMASRLLSQLRTTIAGSDEVSDRLAQDLLFFCARARSPGEGEAPRLAAVRAAWRLDDSAAADYDVARLGRFDPSWVAQARKRVAGAKDAWSGVAGGEEHRLTGLAEQFTLVGDSLQRLFPSGEVLAAVLQDAAAQTVAAQAAPPAPLAMEVATALLYLDASLEDGEFDHPALPERVQRLARRVDDVRRGQPQAPLEPWMEELYRRVSDRQTMGSVVQELRASLSEAEKQIDAYFRDPTQREALIPVPGQLSAMRGVLSVLGLDQASQAVLRMRDEVDTLAQTEVDPTHEPARLVFERLAENLGALSFLIDMLGVQPGLAKSLFRYDADTGRLSTLMGQEAPRAPAPPPVAPPVPSAPPPPVAAAPVAPAPAAPAPSAEDDEMRAVFLEEAGEVIPAARESLARLAEEPEDLGEMTAVRRAFHTLKGSSRMVGLKDFGEAAWACEQLFNSRLAQSPRLDPALRAFTTEALDYFGAWVAALAAGRDEGHASPPVVRAADGLRLDGQRLAIAAPAAAEAPAVAAEAPPAVAPELPVEVEPGEAAEPPQQPEVTETVDEALAPDFEFDFGTGPEPAPALAERVPDLPSAADLDLDLGLGAAGPAPAADEVDFSFDLGALEPEAEPAPAVAEPEPVDAELPLETPETFEAIEALQPLPAAPPAPEAGYADFDFDLGERTPAEAAEPAAAPLSEAPAEEPAAEDTAWPERREDEPADEPLPQPVFAESEPEPEALPAVEVLEGGVDWPLEAAPDAAADSVPEAAPPVAEATPLPAFDEAAFEAAAYPSEPPPQPAVPMPALPDIAEAFAELPSLDGLGAIGAEPAAEPLLPPEAEPVSPPEPEPSPEPVAETPPPADEPPADEEPVKIVGPLRVPLPLFNIYLNEADELSRRLGTELAEWALEAEHRPVSEAAVALAHSLAGSSATVGYAELSALARSLEHALMRSRAGGRGRDGEPELFGEAAEEIRRLLHQFAAGFLRPASPALVERLAEHERWPELPPRVAADTTGLGPLDADDDDLDAEDALDPELFPIFEDEADELLPQLLARLRDWADNPADSGAAAACMRTLHTFKGGARLAGAMRLGERAHRMETAIERLGDRGGVHAGEVETLLARADAMVADFEALRTPAAPAVAVAEPAAAPALAAEPPPELAPPPEVPAAEIDWSRFASATPLPAVAPERAAPAGAAAVRVRGALLDRMVNHAGEVSIARARLDGSVRQLQGSLGELTESLERMRAQLRDIELQAESQMVSRLEAAKAAAETFDPLEMDRFTRLQELTRFMAESVNDVATLQRSLQRTLQSAEDDLAAQARLARELQGDLLRTRMVEFDSASDRLYRTVRQAAKETGKSVRLDILGGAIEVDRGVLERMTGPFEHLLRNAVVHGIEPAAARAAAGKDTTGTITLVITQEGNEVGVELRDDGAGLDLARIRERAAERGLLAAGAPVDDEALAQLVFAPGFSTAADVTELAGRGVGLDVVRSEVDAMGGRVQLGHQPGRGTSFKLLLPLTTAVTQVVMLRCGERSVAVPSTLIEAVRRAPPAEVEAAYASGVYTDGGQALPFHWLAALLDGPARGATTARSQAVVVVRSAEQRVALHVDEVAGNQDVVVKNVGPQLARVPGLAGVTLLPSGAVALIYNPVALATLYGPAARARLEQVDGMPLAEPAPQAPAAPLVLVVDDSLTVRRVTQRLLQREGWRVVTAKDGVDALERLAEERPAVMLSDIEMPRMDGFELLRAVRAEAALAGLPIVMITSRIAQKHRDHAAALGADHYLGKPYAEEELLALVARYAGAARPS
ncbi:chemosensory pili system protein ChpA (sensor histidine kinase/response regulator) [Rubrivivax gelatinosus]|uniref:hybrid sensor histidine kinase/response regulator n=2 Tax=Rubrivivax gelatinosus TaxID=28068 RepID=UPI0018CBA880|nr:Hpt domain-containing protein [Rubrivivax gelatinosus]MBG6079476.1 chemosensory pili system protein ChpA (sensor histidine kinase/response regulator) [Rubrivivax gelatinosus]